jgi:hypothetical protein
MNDPDAPFRLNLSAIAGVGITETQASAVGVGNNPEPISEMGRVNGGSRYAMPFRIKPERGQVSENVVKPSMAQV